MTRLPPRRVQGQRAAGLILLIATALSACASQPESKHRQPCPEQQPEACTMDYAPVIGFSEDSEDQGVFSNHCSACREDEVDYTVPREHARD